MRLTSAAVGAALIAALLPPEAVRVEAQSAPPAAEAGRDEGVLPDAAFGASFRKYVATSGVYSPYFSWDADMSLALTVFRKGADAADFGAVFQTVGTESLGSKVSVGGTGYVLRAGYVHTYSPDFTLSGGISHLSTHLTRDLDDKTDEQRRRGVPVPDVADASEYNVFYVKGAWRLRRWPLAPGVEATLHPFNFRFDGGSAPYVRPLHLRVHATAWRGYRKSLAVETQLEVGRRPFGRIALLYHLQARDQDDEGRLQLFLSATPGHRVHVSPDIGALRGGVAVGVRLRFH